MDMFAQNIREIRQVRCYSQEFMANELGIHTSNYNRLETGIQQARVSRILKIAEILQVHPYELFVDKTIRKRLEQAQFNEQRLHELEREVAALRKILLLNSTVLHTAQLKEISSIHASVFQGYIS